MTCRRFSFVVSLVVMLAIGVTASANLVINGGFDDQTGSPWWGVYDSAQYVNDSVNGDTILSLGWWWYDYVMQDTGVQFQPNTVYTMTALARDGDGGSDWAQASILDVDAGYTQVAVTSHTFVEPTFGDGSPWEVIQVTFDTATNPDVVGHNIGVGLTAPHDSVAAWTQFDSVELIPEPSTIGLLALGLLALRRRK